MKRQSKLHKQK